MLPNDGEIFNVLAKLEDRVTNDYAYSPEVLKPDLNLTDRPHHYRASSPPVQRGRQVQSEYRESAVLRSAQRSCWGSATPMRFKCDSNVRCDRAVPDQVHLYLFWRSMEEVWMTAGGDTAQLEQGCWRVMNGAGSESLWETYTGRLEMPKAVSLNEYKHAEGVLHT